MRRLTMLAVWLPLLSAQPGADPLELARLKDFRALRSSSNNPDPDSNDDSKRPIPGETITLADLEGPGVVTHIWLTVAANEYGWPRLLRLRVHYDGSAVASVDAPVGDFFGVGHGMERGVNSLLVRNASSGRARNCYWPMPFRRSCKITVTNEGRRRVSNLYYHVDWQQRKTLPADIGYFHALYRQELPAARGKLYDILSVNGRGHLVGTVLSVIQAEPGWFGEGDEFFYVDGERKAAIEGTGTEDYFNDAWSLRVAEGPCFGVTVAEGTGTGSRMSAYRWHPFDPVPFARSLRFGIEHAGWTYNSDGGVRSAFEERADLFSSVAFWYQAGVAAGLPEPPYGAARLPHGNGRQIEVENHARQSRAQGGTVEVQKEVFWSKDVLLFRAEGAGARLQVPFDADATGRYEIVAQLAHAPDYGIYDVLLDERPMAPAGGLEHEPGANTGSGLLIDGWHNEVYVGEDHLLGWAQLERGPHALTFVCKGKAERSSGYNLGIDGLVLARIGQGAAAGGEKAARLRRVGWLGAGAAGQLTILQAGLKDPDPEVREAAMWSLGRMGEAVRPAVEGIARALGDPDPVVRGLAAVALREAGEGAEAGGGSLIAALQDPDANVRMMSAEALARLGAKAAPAVAALMKACQRPGEHVHVLRSLAGALGAAGGQARPAVAVLRQLEAMPRVRWAAQAAIRRIEAGGGLK